MRTIKFISDIVEEKVLITKLRKLEYEKQIYKLHIRQMSDLITTRCVVSFSTYMDDENIEYDSYIPLVITVCDDKTDLSLYGKILSNYGVAKINTTQDVNNQTIINFLMNDGSLFYINPKKWMFYSELLSSCSGKKYVGTNPLVILDSKVSKLKDVEVYVVNYNVDITDINYKASYLEQKGYFMVSKNYLNPQILKSYDYEHTLYDEYVLIKSHDVFDKKFYFSAFDIIEKTGNIPIVEMVNTLNIDNLSFLGLFIYVYTILLKEYDLPYSTSDCIGNIMHEKSSIKFMCHNFSFYKSILDKMKSSSLPKIIKCNQYYYYRYSLSMNNIRSFTILYKSDIYVLILLI